MAAELGTEGASVLCQHLKYPTIYIAQSQDSPIHSKRNVARPKKKNSEKSKAQNHDPGL